MSLLAENEALRFSVTTLRAGLDHAESEVSRLTDALAGADERRRCAEDVARQMSAERDAAISRAEALAYQIEHEGCAVSHIGEGTYNCRAESPCGLCRLRLRAASAEARLAEARTRALPHGDPADCFLWYDGCHCREALEADATARARALEDAAQAVAGLRGGGTIEHIERKRCVETIRALAGWCCGTFRDTSRPGYLAPPFHDRTCVNHPASSSPDPAPATEPEQRKEPT